MSCRMGLVSLSMQGDGPDLALGEHSMFGKRAGVAGSLLGWRAGVGVKGRLARRGRTGGSEVLVNLAARVDEWQAGGS